MAQVLFNGRCHLHGPPLTSQLRRGCVDAGPYGFKYMVPVGVAIHPLPRVAQFKGLFAMTGIQGMPSPANEWSYRVQGTTAPF